MSVRFRHLWINDSCNQGEVCECCHEENKARDYKASEAAETERHTSDPAIKSEIATFERFAYSVSRFRKSTCSRVSHPSTPSQTWKKRSIKQRAGMVKQLFKLSRHQKCI